MTEPNVLRHFLHSSSVPPAGANRGRVHDITLDALLDKEAEVRRLEQLPPPSRNIGSHDERLIRGDLRKQRATLGKGIELRDPDRCLRRLQLGIVPRSLAPAHQGGQFARACFAAAEY